jgi:transcriptional regulator with XRE-family HTH domain
MSEKSSHKYPFQSLGERLKHLREGHRQSLAEVSGAVEIDSKQLKDIEQGVQRPSEDVLMLLASFFGLPDDETNQLWEMAGYSSEPLATEETAQPVYVMPMDLRIVYADMFHVALNDYGVMMNFMQSAGPGRQPLAVARLGMSREHAQQVLETLQKALSADNQPRRPRFLPNPDQSNDPK